MQQEFSRLRQVKLNHYVVQQHQRILGWQDVSVPFLALSSVKVKLEATQAIPGNARKRYRIIHRAIIEMEIESKTETV